jgi:mono/diheme cytochrome c family protein
MLLSDLRPHPAGESTMDRLRPLPARTRAHAAVAALLALAFALPALAAAQAKAGDPAKGKGIFMKNCMVCHNPDGSGGKKLTPNGNPSRDFREAKFWSERTDAQIRDTINKGVAKSGMIAWKGILKPSEIEDVMAYIKTFAKKADAAKAGAAKADASKVDSPEKK